MARFVRNSVLRAQGQRPSAVLGLRARARKAEATVALIRESVAGVTNGTGRKIARLLSAEA